MKFKVEKFFDMKMKQDYEKERIVIFNVYLLFVIYCIWNIVKEKVFRFQKSFVI